MSANLHLFIATMILACRMTWCTNHDVGCDPDIPSRPQAESSAPGVAMAQEDLQEIVCDEGEYLDTFECLPCEYGTYRTKQMAREDIYSGCQKCYSPGMYEKMTENCTRTRDAKIMCEDGFYRYEAPGKPCQSQCVRCDICGVGRNMFKIFESRGCGGYSNTVCCENDNIAVVDGRCVAMTITTTTTTTASTSTAIATTSNSKIFIPTNTAELEKNENYQRFYQTSGFDKHTCQKYLLTLMTLLLFIV